MRVDVVSIHSTYIFVCAVGDIGLSLKALKHTSACDVILWNCLVMTINVETYEFVIKCHP